MTLYDRYMTMNPMAGVSATDVAVTITGVDQVTGILMVRDTLGNEFEIDGNNRMKGVGLPLAGERWRIAKSAGQWYLKTQIGSPSIPTITGARDGMDPVVAQLLDAMASQGMVIDATTAAPIIPPDPDLIPYAPGDPDYVDPTLGDDDIPDIEENEGDSNPDDYDGPSITPTPVPPTPVQSTGQYLNRWVPLYAGTFNTFKDLGPRAAKEDLVKLTKSRLQIVGLQEAHGNERDSIFSDDLADLGWSRYRPKDTAFSDEDTIIWRTDKFDLLDSGCDHISTVDIAGMPPRYLNWVKVRFKPANRLLYFMSTHVDPHLDVTPYTRHHVGKPNFKQYNDRVHQGIVHFSAMQARLRQFGRIAPVILAGDFNISATADARVRYKGFPYAKFSAVGAKSNWTAIKHDPHGPTHGQIDQIWLARGSDWFVKFVDHWGFAGYHSDHRPVMTEFNIRAKS